MKTVIVKTSEKLDNYLKSRIEDFLRKKNQGDFLVSYEVDPSIIGGIVIDDEGLIYDASVMTQLKKIRNSLT